MHCQNTDKHVCMEMVLAEFSMLVGCGYLAKRWLGMKTYSKTGVTHDRNTLPWLIIASLTEKDQDFHLGLWLLAI